MAHDPRGSGRLRHTAPTRVTAPGADGASPLHGAAPPGTALGGGVAGGRTGHLLARGSGEFPEAPLRQLPVPLEGKGGREVLWVGDERLGCRGAPQCSAGSLSFRGRVRRARVCVGGRRCLCPAPPPRVSDCPGSGSSAASPPPPECLKVLPHVTSRQGVWRHARVSRPLRPLRTLGGSGCAEGKRRGVGVSARGHREMSVPGACWFVSEGVLPRGGVGAWLRCSCWGAAPPPPNIHTCRGWRGGAGPSAHLPHLRRDFPGLAGEAGVGSCKGICWPLDLILLRCVTLNRCLLFTEPPPAPL